MDDRHVRGRELDAVEAERLRHKELLDARWAADLNIATIEGKPDDTSKPTP